MTRAEGPRVLSPARWAVRWQRLCPVLLLLLMAMTGGESAAGQERPFWKKEFRIPRGMTGKIVFEYSGRALQARAQRDVDAPLWLRLQRLSGSPVRYEATFAGAVAGTWDLRSLMEHADGSAVTEIGPVPVVIVSTLHEDRSSDLFAAAEYQPVIRGGYRVMFSAAVLIWLGIPVVVLAVRHARRAPVADAVEPVPIMTLADQIRPLVEAAARGTISVADQSRLELLLYHHWRERESLQATSMVQAIQQLRQHPEAGPLLLHLEQWLHAPESRRHAALQTADAIVDLLRPYAAPPAVSENVTSGDLMGVEPSRRAVE